MSGFPRSGSTLLASLLNQNPKIYASHNTNVYDAMSSLLKKTEKFESISTEYRIDAYEQVLRNIPHSYYEDLSQEVIIDKSRSWCTLEGIKMAQKINPDVKIIFTIRPILEILASFIRLAEKNSKSYIDKSLKDLDFSSYHYRPINDARCDLLMRNGTSIDNALFGYALSKKDEYRDMFHFVYYDDLCSDPQEELNKIYDFLGIDRYEHYFQNIENKEKLNDLFGFGIPSLHNVRKNISKISVAPEKVLSDYVIQKYGNAISSLDI